MIDDQVLELSNELTRFWNSVFSRFPHYQLDYSWPSVGTLDYLLYGLRHRTRLSETDELLLKGAAAYLCKLAHDCWKTFPDGTQVHASCSDTPFDIVLTASFGNHLPKSEYFVVSVYRSLARVLAAPANPFPCFGNFAVPLAPRGPLLPYFAMGLCSGLCPYGRGRWRERSPQEFAPNLMAVAMHLADSSAAYYTRLFPLEPRGQLPQLYSGSLIFPPPGMDEPQPFCRPVAAIAAALKGEDAADDEIFSLGRNLAMMPDPISSGAGFALAAAVQDAVPADALKGVADAQGVLAGACRPAVLVAREIFAKRKGWLEHYLEKDVIQARNLVGCELDLNLLPLVEEIITWRVGDPAFYPLFEQLALFRPAESYALLSTMDAFGGMSPDLELQQVALLIVLGKHTEAAAQLASLQQRGALTHAELELTSLDLEGRLADACGEPAAAQQCFERAQQLQTSNVRTLLRQRVWLANRYTALGNVEPAESLLRAVITEAPYLHSARISLLLLLQGLDRVDETLEEQEKLIRLAPGNHRTHAAIKACLLHERLVRLKEEEEINKALEARRARKRGPTTEEA